MLKQRGYTLIPAALLLVAVLVVGGWFANLYKLIVVFPATFADATPIMVFRALGVFVPPIGAVLGFF